MHCSLTFNMMRVFTASLMQNTLFAFLYRPSKKTYAVICLLYFITSLSPPDVNLGGDCCFG